MGREIERKSDRENDCAYSVAGCHATRWYATRTSVTFCSVMFGHARLYLTMLGWLCLVMYGSVRSCSDSVLRKCFCLASILASSFHTCSVGLLPIAASMLRRCSVSLEPILAFTLHKCFCQFGVDRSSYVAQLFMSVHG